ALSILFISVILLPALSAVVNPVVILVIGVRALFIGSIENSLSIRFWVFSISLLAKRCPPPWIRAF
ncbi:MAG: hypothetical protein MR629_07610, partial [Helicobacter sp.]|nr:hypothetical protein [Helicobacter sp.]